MNRNRFNAEEIVNKLRKAAVLLSKRQIVARACKQIDVTMDMSRACERPVGDL